MKSFFNSFQSVITFFKNYNYILPLNVLYVRIVIVFITKTDFTTSCCKENLNFLTWVNMTNTQSKLRYLNLNSIFKYVRLKSGLLQSFIFLHVRIEMYPLLTNPKRNGVWKMRRKHQCQSDRSRKCVFSWETCYNIFWQ
jgi:hypothetical protein